jgi:hypothetical protein
MTKSWVVVTTINPPTKAIEAIARLCQRGWSAVVVGDNKTPADWHCEGIHYFGVAEQRALFGPFADAMPFNHYCRKNLGYLYAIRHGAEVILDTDDDNYPYETFGVGIRREVQGRLLRGPGWVNVYQHFTDDADVWPRGLPLDAIHEGGAISPLPGPRVCLLQQSLADKDPDVDAIFRLTTKRGVFFDRTALPVVLAPDTWCPCNSQNTVFFREAFPLLYLPCHVSFRMTDIWRSFVAQAVLGHHGFGVSFHSPTVEQIRNEHNLMRDFADEVPGYLGNRDLVEVLKKTLTAIEPGRSDLVATAWALWQALREAGFITPAELALIEAWLELIPQRRARRRALAASNSLG